MPNQFLRVSLLIAAVLVAAAGCLPVSQISTSKELPATFVDLKPADGHLNSLLQIEVNKAVDAQQKPFVEMTADWCKPCKELKESLDDPLIADAFAGTYIIRLKVDDWKPEQLEAIGLPSDVVPVFCEMNEEAKATGRKIDGGAWAANIPINMAPPLKKFFHPPAK
ncbi:hypothetical protein NA78x_002417 [Anatilimnocola sp. NA78]|uniref:hypothetical protein n=1 Tax=Anatilimnocola sp. NA78 TaxID=3415683 RepID=UPI003CE574D9